MTTFIIKTDLNEYLLCLNNGIVISTSRKYEAKKYFSEADAQKDLKVANTKKRKWKLERID